jgi:hypothetical protein
MFEKVVKSRQEASHAFKNGTHLNMWALLGTCVVGGVFVSEGPNIRVAVIGPLLTQLDPCDPLVPC